jgi:hypothetical protein
LSWRKNDLTPSEYTAFYKSFCLEFSRYFKLENYLDFSTCDVSRVCFVSVDEKAYFNPDAMKVDPYSYLSDLKLFNSAESNEISNDNTTIDEKKDSDQISKETYKQILQKLNPKTPKRTKDVFVPEAINEVIEPIKKVSGQLGIRLTEIIDIQYGRKLRFAINKSKAEINIFFGKRGFSVVECPVRNYDKRLSEIVKLLTENVIYSPVVNEVPTEVGSMDFPIDVFRDLLKNNIHLN